MYKRSLQAAKREKCFSLERRLSYKGSPGRIAGSDQKQEQKGKSSPYCFKLAQAVLRLEYVEDGQENVTMEEANEGEQGEIRLFEWNLKSWQICWNRGSLNFESAGW